ncbi:MAG: OprO/OprP family phosphate-selective porin [bacterium]
MDINKNPFCPILSVFILILLIFFSTHLFSEEIKPAFSEPLTHPGRRVLQDRRKDKVNDLNHDRDKNKNKNKDTVVDKDRTDLKLGVTLMWDYDQFNGIHINRKQKNYQVVNETELRRASIDIECEIDDDWQAEFQVSFEDEDQSPEVEDAFISFTGWENFAFKIGQTKEPFGLEELTSSKQISLIERSMATSAFAPGNHPGLEISGHQRPFTWAIGCYESEDNKNKRDSYALTGRFVMTPWEYEERILHIGAAGSFRDFNGEEYKIETHAEVHTAEEIVRIVETQADEVQLLGLELVSILGPFSIQAEHMGAKIKATVGKDAFYSGYYIQGSYFLTGETRSYKKGTFKSIKPLKTYGALELLYRYSFLDAEDNNNGVRVSNHTLGANYYFNKWIRLMANYIKTTLVDGVSEVKCKADAISFRMQFAF